MTTLDSLIVQINADIGGLKRQMRQAENTVDDFGKRADSASTRVSSAFRRLANSAAIAEGPLSGIAGRFSAISTGAGLFGAAAIGATAGAIALGAGMTKAANAGEQVKLQMAKLEAIIKATGGSAGLTANQIDGFARNLALNTLTSTDAVRNAAGQLLTFRSVATDVFEDALTLSQDLAATGFGSIEQNAVQLGKALEDPVQGIAALKRVGVSFTQTQRDMIRNFIESGEKVEAQRQILEALRLQVGGAGSAEAGTLTGAFDTLGQKIDEAFEAIDKAAGASDRAARVVNMVAVAVEKFTDAISDNRSELKKSEDDLEEQQRQLEKFQKLLASPELTEHQKDGLRKQIEDSKELIFWLGESVKEEKARAQAVTDQAEAAREAAAAEEERQRVELKRAEIAAIFEKELESMERQLGLLGKNTELERTLWEIESGRFNDFNEKQKEKLRLIAREIDLKRAEEERARNMDKSPQGPLVGQEDEIDAKRQEYHDRQMDRISVLTDWMNANEEQRADAAAGYEDAIESFRSASWDSQASIVTGGLAKMTAANAKHSKKMFEINKAAETANAIVRTASAVTRALSDIPAPANFVVAAATAAAGAAQIATIQSQTFGGGGGKPSAPGGAASSGEAQAPAAAAEPSQNKNISIQLVGETHSSSSVRALIRQISEELGDGVTISA